MLNMWHTRIISSNFITQPYLANPQTYKADTWDLTDDIESRIYWLNTFRDSTDKTAKIGRLGYILPVLDTLME